LRSLRVAKVGGQCKRTDTTIALMPDGRSTDAQPLESSTIVEPLAIVTRLMFFAVLYLLT